MNYHHIEEDGECTPNNPWQFLNDKHLLCAEQHDSKHVSGVTQSGKYKGQCGHTLN